MKSILVIGMGRFGKYLAIKLSELGNDVMVSDISEDEVNDVISKVTSAQIGDCTNEKVLRSMGVGNFDICFVTIADNFQASLEITSLLKELGASYVVSKAGCEVHAKFLLRNGADEVIYAEKEMAEKLAVRHSANNIFDYIELTPEFSIFEIKPLDSWLGKTIEQAAIRTSYHINILATKVDGELFPLPRPDYVFTEGEHLMVIGKRADVMKIINKK